MEKSGKTAEQRQVERIERDYRRAREAIGAWHAARILIQRTESGAPGYLDVERSIMRSIQAAARRAARYERELRALGVEV